MMTVLSGENPRRQKKCVARSRSRPTIVTWSKCLTVTPPRRDRTHRRRGTSKRGAGIGRREGSPMRSRTTSTLATSLAPGKNAAYGDNEQDEEHDKRREHSHWPRQPPPIHR